VKFSRPVRADTLKPDCFAMTVISTETEGGWWQVFRVPIVRIDTSLVPVESTDPAGHVRSARIVVSGGWLADAVYGRYSIFLAGQTRVENRGARRFYRGLQQTDSRRQRAGTFAIPFGKRTGRGIRTFRPSRSTDGSRLRRPQRRKG